MLSAAVAGTEGGVCLYPTPVVLASHPGTSALGDRPYTERLARGEGQLDVAYLRMDVLEAYRNDPRFSFAFDDFGACVAVTDEVYEDESEPEADKVSITDAKPHPIWLAEAMGRWLDRIGAFGAFMLN